MLKKPRRRAKKQDAPAQPAARPTPPAASPAPSAARTDTSAAKPHTATPEYAALGSDAPIAWPSVGGRRVPVTGQLSPHAAAALRRMGITKE